MQQFLDAIGYKSGGYKATIEDLNNKEYWPCIVLTNVYNYKHFVVLKGIYKDHVFVADPFIGNTSYSIDKFKKIWDDGVMFIVWADKEKTIPNLKLTRKDLRYIDKELQETLMAPVMDPTNEIEQYRLDDTGSWKIYKK
jgi:predicted double-glycine peptidase